MCRADVDPAAEAPLARLLAEIAAALAAEAGVGAEAVRIGPVDFGPPLDPD